MAEEISPENEEFLQAIVAEGSFPSRATALNTAIDLLRNRQQLIANVRAGIDQADRGEVNPAEEVFARLEARARELERLALPNR
jgi:predicted transcriptional regulator